MSALSAPEWYVDERIVTSTEQLSLDLTRHLPQRLAVGPAVIVTEKPTILLPVIRKRWMRIIREVERQRSCTLERIKRRSLERELERLRSLRFTTKLTHPYADVLVITPAQTVCSLPAYCTVYVATPLTAGQFAAVIEESSGGVVVVYGEWTAYEQVLRQQICQPPYGEGLYPVST